jgi:hypothetical protein
MKTLGILLLTFFMIKGCSKEQVNDLASAQIEYSASKRGFYEKITIENHTVYCSKNREDETKGEAIALSKEDGEDLLQIMKNTNLEHLASFEGPTQKRFYDGAAIASIKITYKGKEYQSNTFDHGFPPKEIEKLVFKVVELGEKRAH